MLIFKKLKNILTYTLQTLIMISKTLNLIPDYVIFPLPFDFPISLKLGFSYCQTNINMHFKSHLKEKEKKTIWLFTTCFIISNPQQSILPFLYHSVMQSDGNRFCRDVVLDSFVKASRDEDSILYKRYIKHICLE